MTASSRRLIELSFLALLDSGIDYRGRKVGSFFAGTNTEALAQARQFNPFVLIPPDTPLLPGLHRLP